MTDPIKSKPLHVTNTIFGFDWGPMTVERCVSDPKWGVTLVVKTARGESVEIRSTPFGRLRIGPPRKSPPPSPKE